MATPHAGNASLIGQTFAGYHVLGLVGRGAMGAVYLAEDVQLQRRVALKVLLGTLARNPAMVKSFQMEARAAAPLRHNNIVRVYNAGLENGTPFMAMEYVEGEPLDRFLRRKGHMPWQTALFIGQQVAEALDCAHGHGLVHRDVKPANILLDAEGRARLTDFGIANAVGDKESIGPQGAFVGTPHYMSPEQCSGKDVGPTSDLFALGVMLYRMICGKLPFQSDDPMELIRKITYDEPQRLNRVTVGVPDDVARLVAHLMQKRPEKRPKDAATVVSMIKRLQAEQGGQSALPAALTAFVQEEAEIRPLAHGGGKRTTGIRKKGKKGGPTQTWEMDGEWFGAHIRGIGLALLAVVCAVAGGQIALAMRSEPEIPEQPVISIAMPVSGMPGARSAVVASNAFVLRDFSFRGDDQIIAVADGRPGSIMDGSRGLVRLDLESGNVYNVRPPVAPTMDPNADADRMIARAYGNDTTSDVLVSLDSRRGNVRGLHFHTITESVANSDTYLTLPQSALSSDASIEAIVRDGDHVVVLLSNHDHDRIYSLRDDSGKTIAREIAESASGTILPESVHADRAGTWVAYIKAIAPGRRELWIAPGDGSSRQPTLLTLGELGDRVAFSPDGQLVAYSITERDGRHMIHTIHASSLRDVANIGEGRIIENGWNHKDNMIYAIAPVPDGAKQLVRMQPSGTGLQLLTDFTNGLGDIATISPEGRRVVMDLAGDRPRLVLLDLSQTTGAGLALNRPAAS